MTMLRLIASAALAIQTSSAIAEVGYVGVTEEVPSLPIIQGTAASEITRHSPGTNILMGAADNNKIVFAIIVEDGENAEKKIKSLFKPVISGFVETDGNDVCASDTNTIWYRLEGGKGFIEVGSKCHFEESAKTKSAEHVRTYRRRFADDEKKASAAKEYCLSEETTNELLKKGFEPGSAVEAHGGNTETLFLLSSLNFGRDCRENKLKEGFDLYPSSAERLASDCPTSIDECRQITDNSWCASTDEGNEKHTWQGRCYRNTHRDCSCTARLNSDLAF